MKKNSLLVLLFCMILASCNPSVYTTISTKYPPLNYNEDVLILGLQDKVPEDAVEIGTVKLGDTGFSTNCDYQTVMDKAILEARKAGGNVLKIDQHKPPSAMGSSCHRITARILRTDNIDELRSHTLKDTLFDGDYAIVNIYRYGGTGALVSYNLYLGDSLLCRVTNKFCQSVILKKEGDNILWAKTESKAEVPIDIKFGHTYFLRCGVTLGLMVGRPKLEIVDFETGRAEYNSLKSKK
ncbi:hypothetical protein ACE1ET_07705 [Saccharicrinis sp. FJH62]|uniref:hypothetical protein n=1 Tax=Saccharicrinis sp. FJH62 TaxID=3344657 RepID=UPI0035D4ECEA